MLLALGQLQLGSSLSNVAGAVSPPAPVDWRAPMTMAVSSGLTGSLAALTAAQASASSKSRPSITITGTSTEYFEATATEAGTYILSWLGELTASTTTITKNGASVPYTKQFPSGSSVQSGVNGTGGRRQAVMVDLDVGDVLRYTSAGTGTRTIYPLIHKKPASGSWDAHLSIGASRESTGIGCKLIEDAVIAADATRDPIVFSYAVSGYSFTQCAAATTAGAAAYNGIAYYCMLGSVIGNNVTANHPYDSGEDAGLNADWATIIAATAGKFVVGACATSYRQYTSVNPPANTPANQLDGSLGYNINNVNPTILANWPYLYDPSLKTSRIDEYSAVLRWRQTMGDGIHGAGVAQADIWVTSYFRWIKTGTWPVSQHEKYVALAETNATVKANAYLTFREATYIVSALEDSASAKAGFVARLDAIEATSLFYEAIRQIDIAELSQVPLDKTNAQAALDAASTAGYTGGTSPNTIADQQARITAITTVVHDQIINIGLGATTAVTGWNRTNATAAGVAIANLNDNTGAATGVGFTITNGSLGNDLNFGLVSGVPHIPDAILLNSVVRFAGDMAFTLTGLDPARFYDVLFMPTRSSDTTTPQVVQFLINGALQPTTVDAKINEIYAALSVSKQSDGSGNMTIGAQGVGVFPRFCAVVIRRRP